jgi:hypothetical protein
MEGRRYLNYGREGAARGNGDAEGASLREYTERPHPNQAVQRVGDGAGLRGCDPVPWRDCDCAMDGPNRCGMGC